MRFRSLFAAAVALVASTALVSCGSDSPTASSPPALVTAVSGLFQSATIDTDVANPLVVLVLDAKAQPVSGASVTWTVTQGQATVTASEGGTSSLGEGRATVHMGSTIGTVRITATVGNLPAVTFTLTATPRVPTQMSAIAGNGQMGTVNESLANVATVRVLDATGAPSAGATVLFTAQNGGQSTPASVATNANGEASTSWKLGTTAGAQTMTASVGGVPTVTFTATARPGTPTQLTIVSGNNQTSTVGQQLPAPVVMLVRDAWNNAVQGATVAFETTAGGGAFATGSAATGADGRASTQWTLGSTLGTNSGTATVAGIGAVALTATATPPITVLAHRVVDAEHNLATNRIITVSANPSRLHIIDPETNAAQSVDLAQVPTSVAVQPNGLFAAVGHDGFISYVNLTTRAVDRVYNVSTDVIDIVLPGNGWVYAFPRTGQWESIRSIALSSGAETLTGSIYAGTLARLHPSGKFIYGAENGISPADFEKYGIGTSSTAGAAATILYDSPYHGDYPMGGNVWVSEDGLRLFARSGRAFRSSEVRAEDMTYGGALSGMSVVESVVQSTAAARIYALPGSDWQSTGASELRVYDAAFMGYRGASVLPRFNLPTGSFASRGRFVFSKGDGTRVYTLIQADGASGLTLDWGLVVYPAAELP